MLKKSIFLLFLLFVMSSHDLYLKMDSYFIKSGAKSVIKLFNGTFDKIDNVIIRGRMVDASLIGGGKKIAVDTSQ